MARPRMSNRLPSSEGAHQVYEAQACNDDTDQNQSDAGGQHTQQVTRNGAANAPPIISPMTSLPYWARSSCVKKVIEILTVMKNSARFTDPTARRGLFPPAIKVEATSARGYAADVFEMEDWALPDRPGFIGPRLRAHPRSLFTPDLGSAVERVRRAIELRAADNIADALAGRPPRDAINEPRRTPASASRVAGAFEGISAKTEALENELTVVPSGSERGSSP